LRAVTAPSPLRIPTFRSTWAASFASYLGTWMQIVAASWLMTTLTSSAALVALVPAATALPVFLLALPAGALADVVDRRRLLVATQTWQFLVATSLAVITIRGDVTPWLLLGLTLALGAGAAVAMPALWATIPDLVERHQLPAAVSLNSAAMTLAQALGPTLGGVIVATAGPGEVFLLNALSFLGVIAAAAAWRSARGTRALPAEHVTAAVRTGLRYVLHAPPLQVVLLRLGVHVFCFSAVPALLVVASRSRLGLDAGGYGLLYGCFGLGGAAGALALPRLRGRFAADRIVPVAAGVLAVGLVALATLRSATLLAPILALAGASSVLVLSSLNLAAQSVLPGWVRGRGLALYLLTFQAALAGGAAVWGVVAASAGVSTALSLAAAGMVAAHLASVLAGARLALTDRVDLTPAHWTEPEFALEPEMSEGPVRIEIEYRIDADDTQAFIRAMRELRRTRRRDGAMQWSLYQDLSDPERHVESFVVSSWAEHERQSERAVHSDRGAVERVLALHRGDPPRVSHLLARR
jgi:MFS family permease